MYDIIGDIHGYATPLRRLLIKLGYRGSHGVWEHSSRQVIFVGDFVDRGPEQLEVIRIAQSMVRAGSALAVMGNHEFNAVAWHTPDPDRPGEYLRRHSTNNRKQHQAFLRAVDKNPTLHQSIVDWFRTLPLYLELEGLRVIHACWHRPSMEVLEQGFLDQNKVLLDAAWAQVSRSGTEPFEALEVLLKGLEIDLPSGYTFLDKDGNPRRRIRTQWWRDDCLTYRDLAQVPPEVIESIPHTPVPRDILPGYDGNKLLFVGHYWLTGTPSPLSPHIACLDYSVAARNAPGTRDKGKLCAYRWNGETELQDESFVWVV